MEGEWRNRLTSWDTELCIMVESLTEMPTEPKNGGDHYFIEVNYSKHNDPDLISAILDAIAGRLGNRLIEVSDDTERNVVYIRIAFSEIQYPRVMHKLTMDKEDLEAGIQYYKRADVTRAIQVKRENVERLMLFVGNGEFVMDDNGPVFHFLNAHRSVWAHAPEESYIVYVKEGLFKIVSKADFQNEYEPK